MSDVPSIHEVDLLAKPDLEKFASKPQLAPQRQKLDDLAISACAAIADELLVRATRQFGPVADQIATR